jgi:GDP-D-mannose dehydratase
VITMETTYVRDFFVTMAFAEVESWVWGGCGWKSFIYACSNPDFSTRNRQTSSTIDPEYFRPTVGFINRRIPLNLKHN